MSAFDDFLKTKTITTGVKAVAQTASPFDVAIANKSDISPFDNAIKTKKESAKQSTSKSTLRWLGKQISKPGNVLAAATEGVGKTIATGDARHLGNIQKNVLDVVTGKSERGYLQQAEEAIPGVGGTIAGLGLSIVADPLNVIGGGLTKLGRLSKIVTAAKKAGEPIVEGSKVWNKIRKAGYTVEELELATTKAEQALKGQRAFLKAGDVPLLPAKTSAQIYRGLGKTGEAVKKIPGVSYVGEKIAKGRSLFNTGTGNAAADRVFQAAKNRENFLGDLKDAIGIKKDLIKFSKPEEYIQVANYMEKGITPLNPKLKEIGDKMKPIWESYVKMQQEAGLPVDKIDNYFAHILEPSAKDVIPEGIGSAKKYSSSLGTEKSREIKKFKSAEGDTLIGTVKSAGLKPVDNVKGLTHDITWGEFKSLKQVEDRLAQYGVKIKYVPQKYLRTISGNAYGFFDPATREVVIASGRQTLKEVMSTLKHELTHNAHFQLAGNIEMLDMITKSGSYATQKVLKEALAEAKTAVSKEWKEILNFVNKISPEDFKKLPQRKKDYLQSTTELLARVGQSFIEDPAGAKAAFPESFAAFQKLRKTAYTGGFDILDTDIIPAGEKIIGDVYKDKTGKLYQSIVSGPERVSVEEVNKAFGKPTFIEDPALALAYTTKMNAKAVSSAELFRDIRKFAVEEGVEGVEVSIPELAGLKFEPGVAKQLDTYYKAMQPDEIRKMFKIFDNVQNWWKGQALVSPAYHLRNSMGNLWNLFLMGVKDPSEYVRAGKVALGKGDGIVTDLGKKYTPSEIMDLARRQGVIGKGQFAADIPKTLKNEITGGSYNLFKQDNKLFRANQFIGGGVEDNAKLTGFIHQLKKGLPPEDAAMEVKKFLFDYTDLTPFEQNVMKRALPFYTFTRKNIPLQLEQLVKQPGKYAGLERVVQAVESFGMGDSKPANEKYLSDYIKKNTSMRVKYNENDKSYSYLLLGKWLPAYQAMDFISQPMDNIIQMVTPLLKTPIETMFNRSAFWKNSLDEYQNIERYPGEQTSFLGLNMPKKTAQVLRNIRLLNDIDKANPGLIFGGSQSKKKESIWSKVGMPAVDIPGVGAISASKYKYPRTGVNPTAGERATGMLFGSNISYYKPTTARTYYNEDTERSIQEQQQAIARAIKTGDSERARLLKKKLSEFIRERGR